MRDSAQTTITLLLMSYCFFQKLQPSWRVSSTYFEAVRLQLEIYMVQ
jgi:hypothetical protein